MNEKFFRIAGEAADNFAKKELAKAPAQFGGKPGDPVPEVDADDLKALWQLQRETEARHKGKQVATGSELAKHYCKPGADIQAISYRTGMLSLLAFMAPDQIAPWKKDEQLDDALFRAAAKIPLLWMEVGVRTQGFPFDVEEFFRLCESNS